MTQSKKEVILSDIEAETSLILDSSMLHYLPWSGIVDLIDVRQLASAVNQLSPDEFLEIANELLIETEDEDKRQIFKIVLSELLIELDDDLYDVLEQPTNIDRFTSLTDIIYS